VRDVQRIGNVAQKLAQLQCEFLFYFAACTEIDNQWKKEDDTQSVIQTIHPKVFTATDSRHREYNQNQYAAQQKRVFDACRLHQARQ